MFTSVEATLKTDSMSLRRRDGIRLGGQRNAIPSGIHRAYTSSRKRRKYCVATNKNMYRVFREEFFSFLPPFRYAPTFSSPFGVQETDAKIQESNSSSGSSPLLPIFFHATRNSTDSISKSAIRKCSLSDSYTFLIYYFCEILKGKEFIYLCSLCSLCLLASLFLTHLILISNLFKLFWIIYKR